MISVMEGSVSFTLGVIIPLAILMAYMPILKWFVLGYSHWTEIFVEVCGFIILVSTIFFIAGAV